MAVAPQPSEKSGFLATVERVGRMVPHPAIIFFLLIGIVIVLSVVFGLLGTTVTCGFTGVGVILVAMIEVGLAEESGVIAAWCASSSRSRPGRSSPS